MALPLPRVVSDVGPGGPLVTSMRGANALLSDMYGNQIKNVEAQYAPITTQANAASKLAYANLMGPQFLAKLMGHDPILANMSEDQKRNALGMLYQAGTGGGTGNSLMQMPGYPAQDSNSLFNLAVNKLKGLFGGNNQSQQPINALSSMGGQSNISPQNVQGNQISSIPNMGPNAGPNQTIDSMNQPNAPINYSTQVPAQPNVLPESSNAQYQPGRTFAENTGVQAGVVEEGKEAGKIRAQDIKELNDIVFNGETKQATLDDINRMISSPEIKELRQVPLAGRHELAFYSKYGTPAQQQLIGRMYAQMGNIVKDSSRDFAGQFRRGEQQLLQGMKPNDSDTIDSMIGKAESLTVMNKLLTERARLTSQYMNQYHINKGQASELADKKVNGEAIRSQVHNSLNPQPTDGDIDFMAQKYNVSPDEIRKRLKAKGIG